MLALASFSSGIVCYSNNFFPTGLTLFFGGGILTAETRRVVGRTNLVEMQFLFGCEAGLHNQGCQVLPKFRKRSSGFKKSQSDILVRSIESVGNPWCPFFFFSLEKKKYFFQRGCCMSPPPPPVQKKCVARTIITFPTFQSLTI